MVTFLFFGFQVNNSNLEKVKLVDFELLIWKMKKQNLELEL